MHLNNLKHAWRQVKFMNALEPLAADDVLSIIEASENVKSQVFLLRFAVCTSITFLCQAG
ncbi:MAG: hypothetical protein AAFY48_02940 [Bacteroidota bacterium]